MPTFLHIGCGPKRVEDNGQRQLADAPAWFNNLAHLDQLLATWEWRSGATPWLVMKTRTRIPA